MYYLVYGVLYAISLLPLRVLHLFSSLAFFILYYITGYRKEIVMSNLAIAFPEKSEQERKKIARRFYLNFTDTFIETIKMISISKRELERRASCDVTYMNELAAKGYNIYILAGHQFNWEFANLLYAKNLTIKFIGVYQPIKNKIINRIFYKYRSQFGTVLVSTREFKHKRHLIFNEQYSLALAADQNPSNRANAYWINFFGKPAPFAKGPTKGAVKGNNAVVFVAFEKIKRGYYNFKVYPIAENAMEYSPEELVIIYKKILEDVIRKDPSNYLWSHRRWRHEWQEGYEPILKG